MGATGWVDICKDIWSTGGEAPKTSMIGHGFIMSWPLPVCLLRKFEGF